MARWNVKADANEETAGGGGGNFTPAPRGFYTIVVTDTKDGETQTHRPMVTLTCEVVDHPTEEGKKVWVNVTQIPKGEKGHGIMVHNLHAFGLEHDGDLDFDTDDFKGLTARALLGIKPHTKIKDGKSYTNEVNFVEALYTSNHPEPKELPPAPTPRTEKTAAPTARQAAQARNGRVEEEVGF